MQNIHYDEEASPLIAEQSQPPVAMPAVTDRRLALTAAAIGAAALLTVGSIYSTQSNSSLPSTDLSGMNWGNAQNGVMCADTEFRMQNGNDLYSESRQYRLAFQSDGNVVIYNGGNPIWNSGTYNNGDYTKLQSDGHFLVFKDGNLRWRTGVYGYSKSFLIMQNDGNLVEYNHDNLQAIWNSGTSRNSNKGNIDLQTASKGCYTTAPTPAPIANPTLQPSALPTLQPTPQPTAGPTKWTTFFDGGRPLLKANQFRLNGYMENNILVLARGGGFSCKDQKSALAGIKMNSYDGWSGSGQFFYNCGQAATKSEPWAYLGTTSGATGWNDQGGVIFLDRHNVQCPSGSYLTSLTPEDKDWKFRWNYECAQFASTYKSSECVEQNTGFNDPGNGVFYLDRHLMQCGNNYAITGFKGETKQGQFRFVYNCCPGTVMYPSQNPTPAPQADPTREPTRNPVADPTKKPISAPTNKPFASPTFAPSHEPTKEPIAEPTKEPIANPTQEPIAFPTLEPISEPTMAPNNEKELALEREMKAAAEAAEEKAAKELQDAQDAADQAIKDAFEAKAAADEAAAELAVQQQKEAAALQAAKDEEAAAEAAAAMAAFYRDAAADAKVVHDAEEQREQENKADEAADAAEEHKEAAADATEDAEVAQEKQEDAKDTVQEAQAAIEEAVQTQTDAVIQVNAAKAEVDNAQLAQQVVEKLQVDRKDSLACPFTFKQGVSKIIVPEGCVFVATNDVTYSTQKKMNAPAVYFCTKANVPLQITEKDLKKYGLVNSVSFIQPGQETSAEFFSALNFKGSHAIFSPNNYKPLNSFKYKDGSSANDRVKGIIVTSTTSTVPEECSDISFSSKMQLNTKLMNKAGKFHQK